MRAITQQRNRRVQEAYRFLSQFALRHELCLQIIGEFFSLTQHQHINNILKEDLEPYEYEHEDLDRKWFEARVKKHMDQFKSE